MKINRILQVGLLTLCSAGVTRAQISTATLTGSATDTTGAGIPNVQIKVVNTDTNAKAETTTTGNGVYTVPQLPPGHYKVTAEHPGFQSVEQTGVELTVGQPALLNFRLSIGKATEVVTVSTGVELVNGTSAEIATTISETEIKELPLNGRNPADLVFLTPGVGNLADTPNGGSSQLQATNGIPTQSGGVSGGGRQGSTYYLLDGVPNMDQYLSLAAPFPNADATQEFRVITNNYGAQYGFANGGIVTISTKSGTNQIHGNAYEFFRNDDLNASNYFTHLTDTLKRNQFGGSLGGPLLKNRLFVFGNYQATRQTTQGLSNSTFTPTAAMLAGDFSAYAGTLKAPFATVAGKKNQINPMLFSPAAVAMDQFLPLGQTPSNGQVYYAGPLSKVTYDEGTIRSDFDINSQQRLTARVFVLRYHQLGDGGGGDLLAASPDILGKYQSYLLTHSWALRPNLINALSGSYQYFNVAATGGPKDANGNGICWSRFIKTIAEPVGICSIEGFSASFTAPAGLQPTYEGRYIYSIYELATFTRGRHEMMFGVDGSHLHVDHNSDYPALPGYTFSGGVTNYANADFLLGDVNQNLQGGGESGQVNGWNLALFAQNQFRWTRTLTVTAGLRWEPNLAPSLVGGRGAAFQPGQQSTRYPNAPLGLVFPGDAGITDSFMSNGYNYFEPRIGVAWQPWSGTAFRGGFGIFDAPLNYSVYSHITDIAPFSPTFKYTRATVGGGVGDTIPLDNPWVNFTPTGGKSPFPPFATLDYVPPSSVTFQTGQAVQAAFATNFKLGITQSWNLSIEQQFGQHMALHIAYVGNESYHQMTPIDANPGVKDVRTKFPLFSNIYVENSVGTANYHALLTSLEGHFGKHIQFNVNYAWAKAQDDNTSVSLAFANGVPNPFDLRQNRGISDLNMADSFAGYFILVSPSLVRHNWLMREVLGSWELTNTFKMRSGVPFTIVGGGSRDNSGSLQLQDRADIVPGVPLMVRQGGQQNWLKKYYNPAAFKANAIGTFGTAQRNMIDGPPIDVLNTGVDKNWPFRGHYNVQARLEAFNSLNHPVFSTPGADPTVPTTAGIITSTNANNPPRVLQAAIKFSF